jgi:hypothetical protein
MKQSQIIVILLIFMANYSIGQISELSVTISFSIDISEEISSFEINETISNYPNNRQVIDTTEGDTTIIQLPQIGRIYSANINSVSSGTWSRLANGDSLWRIQINSNSGLYIMLIFNQFYIPETSKLYIYSTDRSQVLGAFTGKNNTEFQKFTSSPIKANSIIVEFLKPATVSEKEKLCIQSIGLITESFDSSLPEEFGSSGQCMINAKCPEFEDWCNQRRSVALIVRILQNDGEILLGTGSLITNERKDGKPLLLTAFHLIDTNDNNLIDQSEKDEIQNWLFIFNHQTENCNNPIFQTTSLFYSIPGATYINSHKNSDYALIQLNQKPPGNYNAYYNGWSNEVDYMTNTGVCFHHPSGDVKKVSAWEKTSTLKVNFWKVKWNAGSTSGGSSGAPLISSEGFIVGQNYGTTRKPACDEDKRNLFGRFDKSWHNFGLNWILNPNGVHSGSSENYISTMSGDETCKENWYFATGNDLHTSLNVSFLDMTSLGTRQYDGLYNAKNSIVAENVTIQSNTAVSFEAGNEIVLSPGFTAEVGCKFEAIINDCEKGCGNGFKMDNKGNRNDVFIVNGKLHDEIVDDDRNKILDDEINIYPNPNEGRFHIVIPLKYNKFEKLQVINQLGQIVFTSSSFVDSEIIIPNPLSGLYFIMIYSPNEVFTKKLLIK